MKQLISLFLLSFSLVSIAGDNVNKSLVVDPNGIVEIDNVRGKIDVIGWDKSEVSVVGTLDDMTEQFIFNSGEGLTIIKVKLPRNKHSKSRQGSDLKIHLPKTAKVIFTGVATDLSVSSLNAGIDINSVSGNITLKAISGRTYINSVSGAIDLSELKGSMQVSTVSGNLKAKGDCEKISISSVTADTLLNLNKINTAHLSTVSGDINISGLLQDSGELSLSSVSGNAYYHVDGVLNAQVSMETAPGGRIVNDISDDKPKSSFINSHNLRFVAGEGVGNVRMSTVSGNIGLKKSDSK
jgi:hypothetical protein